MRLFFLLWMIGAVVRYYVMGEACEKNRINEEALGERTQIMVSFGCKCMKVSASIFDGFAPNASV